MSCAPKVAVAARNGASFDRLSDFKQRVDAMRLTRGGCTKSILVVDR
jgi:hypothetical protein